jgi:hypothetical protein
LGVIKGIKGFMAFVKEKGREEGKGREGKKEGFSPITL